MEKHTLVAQLKKYNDAYRKGTPLVSDITYDQLVEELRGLDSDHPFLSAVEPELFETKREIRHPIPMLSIEKSYTGESLQRFISRVQKEASDIGIHDVEFIITPKLDGLAGRDDGNILASRGNGEVGFDISNAFEKGVIPLGGRGLGIGEIVIKMSYFQEHLSGVFEHPRNMVVGIISSDTLNEHAKKALEDKVVHFVPYGELPSWIGTRHDFFEKIESITEDLAKRTDYPIDGMVASVTDEALKHHMGATTHHYRWQIAIKTKGETAVTRVKNVVWQVGRTGNITPVMEIDPVSLSGATIRRVTAHHAGLIKTEKIGPDAEIEVIRSGEVIPKLEKVIQPSATTVIPEKCPSCSSILVWDNDFLKCRNISCPAQIEQRISHFFKILGTADWFGIKTIQKLVDNKYDCLEKIYAMEEKDFLDIGFGPIQSKNLFNALETSRTKLVEDWRFLAAFGIPDLGKGDSRKLLSHIRLEDIEQATAEDIEKIHGFGEITSKSIQKGMTEISGTMAHMLALGFNLEVTPLEDEQKATVSPISGKGIVFTGKMQHGTRDDMKAGARNLGAHVQSAVSSKTDFLVCGENVGASKIKKAEKANVTIIPENEYLEMIKEAINT